MKEELSALIDGELNELDERRTLKALAGDAELRETWERYHLIRAVMTHELGVIASPDLAERVMARLAPDEPGRNAEAARLRFWPLAGGFAVAASVAAIAILALQVLPQPLIAPNGASVKIAATSGVAAAAGTSVPVASSTVEEPLYPYLVGHSEFMPTAGMGGMLPYVRVVAYPQDNK